MGKLGFAFYVVAVSLFLTLLLMAVLELYGQDSDKSATSVAAYVVVVGLPALLAFLGGRWILRRIRRVEVR